ncbi:39S ribosomal protein L9, mitochondrial [Lampris incognitus]|uniref:39S ribosomal protein L9, mitochondrial n=1 Tax=Lampris incognitus TaxID=2546036 RepID=UPI0024B60521|nr:39S ribosomal protein L9, mitochondrial [Lampris incognitus]
MWSSSHRVLQHLITQCPGRCFSQTACKNTVVVKRWWQVPLSKEGSPPRLYARRHRIYQLVEDKKQTPEKTMELILTQTVEKYGGRGDTVIVRKSFGRNKLLPQGLAVYPSPENKQIFAEELRLLREGKPEDRTQTHTGQQTVEYLKCSHLKITTIPSVEYELTKEIICRQFLIKLGVVVPLHALRLPDEPINKIGDYWCEVTVNGIDTVRVPVSYMPFEDPSVRYQKILKKQRQEQAAATLTTELASSEAAGLEMGDQTLQGVEEAATSLTTPPGDATTPPEIAAAPGNSSAPSSSEVMADGVATQETASVTPVTAEDKVVPSTENPKNN